MLKAILEKVLPHSILTVLKRERRKLFLEKKILKDWEAAGKPVPPPHIVKQLIIKEYQRRYNVDVLVETGTYLGDMVEAQKSVFKKIISIELVKELYENAMHRFRKYNHIEILQGDSGLVLQLVVPTLEQRAIFWLDGHYSGDITALGDKACPIMKELEAILKNDNGHIILIDDANLFNGTGDYPTLAEVGEFLKAGNGLHSMEIKNNLIRLVPAVPEI